VLSGSLARLGAAFFFAQGAFNIYGASLPLYFTSLGFDPTLIGLLIGATGMAELIAAVWVGPAIDRIGSRMVLLCGAACFGAASMGYLGLSAVPAVAGLRLVQGFGLAAVIPATYVFVPHLIRSRRQTLAFASLGATGNVAMALCPPLGLYLLQQVGPSALFLTGVGLAVAAGVAASTVPSPSLTRRPFGLTFRRGWLAPVLVAVLSVAQWGVIQAFVPIEASAAGSNPSLLFTADAISVLLSRLPAGWMADRYGPLQLGVVGVVLMALSPVVLLLPLSDPVLILAGVLNGTGAGLTLPPMLAELSRRSDESTRGTALGFFSVAFAVGMIIGASGGGLLYSALQFHGLLVVGAILCGMGVAVLLVDSLAARPARRDRSQTPSQVPG
jgi:MFS family permease